MILMALDSRVVAMIASIMMINVVVIRGDDQLVMNV